MTVTISVSDIASAIRAGDSESETADITRLLAVATEIVERHAPLPLPSVIQNECVRLIIGYFFDMPNSWRFTGFAGVFRNSGAAANCSKSTDRWPRTSWGKHKPAPTD